METRSVSEGPRVVSGEIVTCGERGVRRSRFGFPKLTVAVPTLRVDPVFSDP
jgi:hypothetical protein